jgi:hypothetical protein
VCVRACRWKGVKVDPQNGHVNKLILPSNNLAGQLPGAALLDLPYLIEIDLRENKINGASRASHALRVSCLSMLMFYSSMQVLFPRSWVSCII